VRIRSSAAALWSHFGAPNVRPTCTPFILKQIRERVVRIEAAGTRFNDSRASTAYFFLRSASTALASFGPLRASATAVR